MAVLLVADGDGRPSAATPEVEAASAAATDGVGGRPGDAVTTTTVEQLDPAACTTAGWPLDQRAAMVMFASMDGTEEQLRELIDLGVGGLVVGAEATGLLDGGRLAAELDAADVHPLVSTDEEGGRVRRLEGIIDEVPSAAEMGVMTAAEVRAVATRVGAEMRSLGFNTDFAPVVDVVPAGADPDGVIGDRSFGSDPATVAALTTEFATGLNDAGIMATIKHFPGHGRADNDSHLADATTPPLSELRRTDLLPYDAILAEGGPLAAVMVGHLIVPELTNGVPASLSPEAVNGLLRSAPPAGLGFDGLVVTDDLANMRAVTDNYSVAEATVLALAAGADMALVGTTSPAEIFDAIETAVSDGRLSDELLTTAADRVLQAQLQGACGS